MDIEKWFEEQKIESVQDRKDGMDYWKNYELFTYNDLIECLEAVKNLELTAVSHHRELLLQAYKEGFDAATDCLIGANKVVQERKLQ